MSRSDPPVFGRTRAEAELAMCGCELVHDTLRLENVPLNRPALRLMKELRSFPKLGVQRDRSPPLCEALNKQNLIADGAVATDDHFSIQC